MDNKKTSKTTHLKDDGSKTNTHEKDSMDCLFYAQINLNWREKWLLLA